MKHSNDDKRILIWRISDQVAMHDLEAQWPRCQVGSLVSLVREGTKPADRCENILADALGSRWTVIGDEFPDFGDIQRSAGVQPETPAVIW